MRKVEGIMIGNKNCKTCFGKGYYAVKHDLTHKNTVSCNCLRPLVRESDIDEVVKILQKWVEYYKSALEKLEAGVEDKRKTDAVLIALYSLRDEARKSFQATHDQGYEFLARGLDNLTLAILKEDSDGQVEQLGESTTVKDGRKYSGLSDEEYRKARERAVKRNEEIDQNEQVADETDERDSGDR